MFIGGILVELTAFLYIYIHCLQKMCHSVLMSSGNHLQDLLRAFSPKFTHPE